MIPLLFVGDGELDGAVVPPLVERLLGRKVRPKIRIWARLHGAGKGYERKLRFAILQARDVGASGLVATVDCDRERRRSRLGRLRAARDAHRSVDPPFPAALAEAVPHAEAWLLDDPVAVRDALSLPAETRIPSVMAVRSPKTELVGLHSRSPRASDPRDEVWRDIAAHVDPARCQHRKETGFDDLDGDVRRELGTLPRASP